MLSLMSCLSFLFFNRSMVPSWRFSSRLGWVSSPFSLSPSLETLLETLSNRSKRTALFRSFGRTGLDVEEGIRSFAGHCRSVKDLLEALKVTSFPFFLSV